MNLILFEESEVLIETDGGHSVSIPLSDRRAVHCTTVLKVTAESVLRVGILGALMYTAKVSSDEKSMHFMFIDIIPKTDLSELGNMSLILAMPRPKVLNRLWSVFGQLGFRRVILVNAERVEKCYFSSHILEEVNYRSRLVKGLEQAAVTTRVPEIGIDKRPLDVFLQQRLNVAFPNSVRFICHPKETGHSPHFNAIEETVIAIGPEGGWLDNEVDSLLSHGFIPVTCSSRIFTTEIAVVALASAVACTLNPALMGPSIANRKC